VSGHTPGPWTISTRSTFEIIAESRNPLPVVAQACGIAGDGGFYEAKANARLIAAAPDLLEALRPFAEAPSRDMDDFPCHVGITTKEKCGRCSRALAAFAAIAKAEARS